MALFTPSSAPYLQHGYALSYLVNPSQHDRRLLHLRVAQQHPGVRGERLIDLVVGISVTLEGGGGRVADCQGPLVRGQALVRLSRLHVRERVAQAQVHVGRAVVVGAEHLADEDEGRAVTVHVYDW